MLMRSDVHDVFDDYQIGYMRESDGRLKLYRFELSGAPSLPVEDMYLQPQKGAQGFVEDVEIELLRAHFQTCLY